jgi:hypothetical protein
MWPKLKYRRRRSLLGHHPHDILNTVKQPLVLVIALLVGAAAPVRAWCEATCLGPAAHADSAKPHCPSHESSSNGSSLSADGIADCPTIESARPVLAKLNLAAAAADIAPHARAPQHPRTIAPLHPCTPAPLHLTAPPLRL